MSSCVLLDSTLGEICNLVTDGTHDTPKPQSDGYPLIKAKEIVGGIIDFMHCDFISEAEHLKVISRSKPEKGDTLFTHIGASLGEAAFVNTSREFSIKNVALFKPNPRIINDRYLYYLVISPQFQGLAKSARTGSAQPFLSLGHLRSHRVRFHEKIEDQEKIAAILSAYDDLIENNLRRIKILEEMAQTIYREWFVKFRFPAYAEASAGRPGHQKVKMVDSPLGKIPEGWEIQQVGEVIETLGGGTPSTKEPSYWEGGNIDWYSPSDLTASGSMFITGSSKKITKLGLEKSSAKLFPAYSLMMTSRATIGVISINTEEACTNQGFITCVPNDLLSVFYLYFWIKESREKIISVASGATFKEISRGEFREFPIAVPPTPIENNFTEIVQPMCRLIEALIKKNQNLCQTRDLLLPKLISGELDVSELDIKIPETEKN